MFTVKLTALSREDGQPVTNEVTVSSVSQQSEDIQPDGMWYVLSLLLSYTQ